MKQNVTLSIEKEILKKGKVVAARKDTSISRMLAELLKNMVVNEERYEAAKRSALQLLKKTRPARSIATMMGPSQQGRRLHGAGTSVVSDFLMSASQQLAYSR